MFSKSRQNKRVKCQQVYPFLGNLKCRHPGCNLNLYQHMRNTYGKNDPMIKMYKVCEVQGLEVSEDGYLTLSGLAKKVSDDDVMQSPTCVSQKVELPSSPGTNKKQKQRRQNLCSRQSAKRVKEKEDSARVQDASVSLPFYPDIGRTCKTVSMTSTHSLVRKRNVEEDKIEQGLGFEILTSEGYRSLDVFSSGENFASQISIQHSSSFKYCYDDVINFDFNL